MPEFLKLLTPDQARAILLTAMGAPSLQDETIETAAALHRVISVDIPAPHPLPQFARASIDGYAVRAEDTYGASNVAPAYLRVVGEVAMGQAPSFRLASGECAVIHTGGMLPEGANAAVMLEHTQAISLTSLGEPPKMPVRTAGMSAAGNQTAGAPAGEVEILRAVAVGENVIRVGEDVTEGEVVVRRGVRLRPAEIGGLMALGITDVRVYLEPRVGIISSGAEVIEPHRQPAPGQVRDVNGYTLSSLVAENGGRPVLYGIVPDDKAALLEAASASLDGCAMSLISGGSSASARDNTAAVIQSLGPPGVLVHGINIRPGKPTIFGVCRGKPVIGLPGNPVSALVIGYLFVAPLLRYLLGMGPVRPAPGLRARLTLNLSSQAGREDWWPVKLHPPDGADGVWIAEPIFGKSNLILSLAAAAGLIRVAPEANGIAAGEIVDVLII